MSVRKNIKVFENVEITYDVICPHCREHAGKMFWGRWIPNPKPALPGQQQEAGPDAQQPQEEVCYVCPHCNQALPSDVSQLRILRSGRDRRTSDRRSGEDRRKNKSPWMGLDRRKGGDRRQGDRRTGEDRRKPDGTNVVLERRSGDRRHTQRSVLYDRRQDGSDRRKSNMPVDPLRLNKL